MAKIVFIILTHLFLISEFDLMSELN